MCGTSEPDFSLFLRLNIVRHPHLPSLPSSLRHRGRILEETIVETYSVPDVTRPEHSYIRKPTVRLTLAFVYPR